MGQIYHTIMAIKLTVVLSFTLFTFHPGQAIPLHVSGPDNRYIFKDDVVNLTCEVRNATGYAIVWHVVDRNGTGIFVGKCFNCPSKRARCSVQPGMDDDFEAWKEGDVYKLTIYKPKIPKTIPFGRFECGYQKVQNCGPNPLTQGIFYFLQPATVYVYDFPVCSVAIANQSGSVYRDFTCTWTPRFYPQNSVFARLTLDNDTIEHDLRLPNGVVSRSTSTSFSDIQRTTANAECTVNLPNNLSRSCNFSSPIGQDLTVFITPLDISIQSGGSQEFRCEVRPNTTIERSWVIFQEEGNNERITTSTSSIAGNVTFSTNSREYLLLTTLTGGNRFFIECIAATADGTDVSAFASLQITQNINSSTSGVLTTDFGETSTIISTMNVSVSSSMTTLDKKDDVSSTSTRFPSPMTESKDKDTSTSFEPSEEPVSDKDSANMGVFIVVPVTIIIIILVVVGFAIFWKRKHRRSFKQPARLIEAQYENTGSNDRVVVNAVNPSGSNDEFS